MARIRWLAPAVAGAVAAASCFYDWDDHVPDPSPNGAGGAGGALVMASSSTGGQGPSGSSRVSVGTGGSPGCDTFVCEGVEAGCCIGTQACYQDELDGNAPDCLEIPPDCDKSDPCSCPGDIPICSNTLRCCLNEPVPMAMTIHCTATDTPCP